jgi:hypothetical protein
MEPKGCPKGRHSAWAPIAGFRSAIGEREFAIAAGGPPPPFRSSRLTRHLARFRSSGERA